MALVDAKQGVPHLPSSDVTLKAPPAADASSCKLELIGAYPLSGVVESMSVLRALRGGLSVGEGAAQRDALLLTFR